MVAALFALLIFCGGCSAFRAMFDEDPAVTKQKREQAEKRKQERRNSGEETEVIPAPFNRKRQKSDSLYISSSLTPEERAILEQTENASKRRVVGDEVETIRRENEKRSDQMDNDVFGSGLNDWL